MSCYAKINLRLSVLFKCGGIGHFKADCPTKDQVISEGNENSQAKTKKKKFKKKKDRPTSLVAFSALPGEGQGSISTSTNSWIIDSGASSHLTAEKDSLSDYSSVRAKITVANKETLDIKGTGNVNIKLGNNLGNGSIEDVKYIPGLAANLLSVSKVTDKGSVVVFSKNSCQVFKESNFRAKGMVLATASRVGKR